MTRPRKQAPSRRYYVTIPEEAGERIEAYAASVDRRPTTAAAELLMAGLATATGTVDTDLAAARRHIEELERQLQAVFRQHRPPAEEEATFRTPRWEWPLPQLVTDRSWWQRWLPSLYELLGRRGMETMVAAYGPTRREPVVDARGYTDLMSYLFPPIKTGTGVVTWRSLEYPSAAAEADRRRGAHEALLPPIRPHVWEPVLRHVAKALCALEQCARAGADPQLRLETDERITGSWVRTLRALVGEDPVEQLPKPIP